MYVNAHTRVIRLSGGSKIKAATVLTTVAATTLREKGGRETFSLRQLKLYSTLGRGFATRRLDEAVFTAYGWGSDTSNDEILKCLLALNQQRAVE